MEALHPATYRLFKAFPHYLPREKQTKNLTHLGHKRPKNSDMGRYVFKIQQ